MIESLNRKKLSYAVDNIRYLTCALAAWIG